MDNNKLLNEARLSCAKTIRLTDEAIKRLNSASRWGLADIIGGNKIISAVKRHKIGKYRDLIKKIYQEAEHLNRVLGQLSLGSSQAPRGINTGFLGHFLDIFADNLLIDLMSQAAIRSARIELKDFREELEDIERQLEFY